MSHNDSTSYQSFEFGKAVFSFEAIVADKDRYADIFSEGSSALKNLLLYLWNNNIETVACCSGHPSRMRSMRDKVSHLHNPHSTNDSLFKDQFGYFSLEANDSSEKTTYTTARALRNHLSQLSPPMPCTVTAHLMSSGFKTNSICIQFTNYLYEPELQHAIFEITNALSKLLDIPAMSNQAKDEKHVMVDERVSDVQNGFRIQERKPALDDRIRFARAQHDTQFAAFQKAREKGENSVAGQGKSVFMPKR